MRFSSTSNQPVSTVHHAIWLVLDTAGNKKITKFGKQQKANNARMLNNILGKQCGMCRCGWGGNKTI